ncbi:MAG: GIY-YIG nuclease family protein [Tissierellaceae bacterium]|nr:GIY-YIG nuclease family protein [Tissierellaceae bacterium]
MNLFYVYMLKCSDDSLYTGYTVDIEKRLIKHNDGKASKYTRSRLPVEVVYCEKYETKSEALKREAAIKKLSRPEKLEIINGVI